MIHSTCSGSISPAASDDLEKKTPTVINVCSGRPRTKTRQRATFDFRVIEPHLRVSLPRRCAPPRASNSVLLTVICARSLTGTRRLSIWRICRPRQNHRLDIRLCEPRLLALARRQLVRRRPPTRACYARRVGGVLCLRSPRRHHLPRHHRSSSRRAAAHGCVRRGRGSRLSRDACAWWQRREARLSRVFASTSRAVPCDTRTRRTAHARASQRQGAAKVKIRQRATLDF